MSTMPEDPCLIPSPRLVTYWAGTSALLTVAGRAGLTGVPTTVVETLASDDGPRSRSQWVGALASSEQVPEARAMVELLEERGVLIPAPRPATEPGVIERVAIRTCDRPAMLRRCLGSVVEHLQRHRRTTEIVVYDDSRDPQARLEVERVVRSLGVDHARVFGLDHKQALVGSLAHEAEVDPELVALALLDPEGIGYNPGANANAMVLDSIGLRILQLDDDVVLRPHDFGTDEVRVGRGEPPISYRFFRSQREALEAYPPSDVDLLAVHERWLGHRWAPGLRVVLTHGAVVGDSGAGFPIEYLIQREPSRAALVSDEAGFDEAFGGRQVLRGRPEVHLARAPSLMMTVCGYDLRAEIPPFLAHGRNADNLFATCVRVGHGSYDFAYLPYPVPHLPTEVRRFTDEDLVRWAKGSRLSDTIADIVASWDGPASGLGAEGAAGIGRCLLDVTRPSSSRFEALLRHHEAQRIASSIAALAQLLDEHDDRPAWWARRVRLTLDALRHAAQQPPIPLDLRHLPPESALERARHLVERHGRLMTAWDALCRAARARRRVGS